MATAGVLGQGCRRVCSSVGDFDTECRACDSPRIPGDVFVGEVHSRNSTRREIKNQAAQRSKKKKSKKRVGRSSESVCRWDLQAPGKRGKGNASPTITYRGHARVAPLVEIRLGCIVSSHRDRTNVLKSFAWPSTAPATPGARECGMQAKLTLRKCLIWHYPSAERLGWRLLSDSHPR